MKGLLGNAYWFKVGIENVNPAAAEVGRQNVFATANLGDGRSLVNGSIVFVGDLGIVHLDDRSGCIHARVPALDCAVFGGKQENRRLARGKKEISGAAVEHDRGGRSGSRLAWGVGNLDPISRHTPRGVERNDRHGRQHRGRGLSCGIRRI